MNALLIVIKSLGTLLILYLVLYLGSADKVKIGIFDKMEVQY